MRPTQQIIAPPKSGIKPGRRIYAVGDIHGRFDLLLELLHLIKNDAGANQDNVLIFLGDYVDRGPDSRRVIEFLAKPALQDFKVIPLKGNHEDMLLDFLNGEDLAPMWLGNGGRETLNSYGVDTAGLIGRSVSGVAVEKARTSLRSAIPNAHLELLVSLDLWHREGDYLFVHAGLKPGVPLGQQKERDLIWIRKEFLDYDQDFGKIVVHGHSISNHPTISANKIGIDTGAWRSDILTALVLEGGHRRFLST
jgi:serine/threonine protein phosphatase 1